MKKNVTLGGEAVRLTASKIITLCISLLNSMLLARIRSFEEYGTYSQLFLVINLITSLLMLGLPNSINFFLGRADSQDEKRKFLSVYYTLSSIFSVGIGVLLVLSIPLIERYFHNPLIRRFYYFLVIYPWASIISSSIGNILIVYKKTSLLIVYNIVHSFSMLAPVAVVHWLGMGFQAYMIAYTAINGFFAVLVYFVVGRLSGGIKLQFDSVLIKSIFRFSIPMGLAAVVGTLNTEIDKLLIGYLMNTEQLAIYTNAARELPLSIISSSITAILLPQMARLLKDGKKKEAIRLWGCAAELALLIVALVVSGVFTFAEEAMTFLYSAKYLPGVAVFRVYSLNLLLRITYFGMVLNASGKSKKIFWCSILSLVFNVVLNPIFYWIFGMIGPAIATFFAIFIVQQLQLVMTSRITGIDFKDVFPWKSLINILLINALLSVVFWFAKQILQLQIFAGEVGESLIIGFVWTIIYIGFMKNRIKRTWYRLNHEGVVE